MAVKTDALSDSGTRLRTQLLMMQSTELVGRGRSLMREWMNVTFEVLALRAFFRARLIISWIGESISLTVALGLSRWRK